jgi:hypothetical protein
MHFTKSFRHIGEVKMRPTKKWVNKKEARKLAM